MKDCMELLLYDTSGVEIGRLPLNFWMIHIWIQFFFFKFCFSKFYSKIQKFILKPFKKIYFKFLLFIYLFRIVLEICQNIFTILKLSELS